MSALDLIQLGAVLTIATFCALALLGLALQLLGKTIEDTANRKLEEMGARAGDVAVPEDASTPHEKLSDAFSCHACGMSRPGHEIAVAQAVHVSPALGDWKTSARYCRDSIECRVKAWILAAEWMQRARPWSRITGKLG